MESQDDPAQPNTRFPPSSTIRPDAHLRTLPDCEYPGKASTILYRSTASSDIFVSNQRRLRRNALRSGRAAAWRRRLRLITAVHRCIKDARLNRLHNLLEAAAKGAHGKRPYSLSNGIASQERIHVF